MKCPRCHGTGKITEWVATDTVSEYEFPCRKCNGTGEIEVTNEEWLEQASTEEKARFLEMICYSAWGDKNSRFKDMADYTDWMEWLKEEHHDSVQG